MESTFAEAINSFNSCTSGCPVYGWNSLIRGMKEILRPNGVSMLKMITTGGVNHEARISAISLKGRVTDFRVSEPVTVIEQSSISITFGIGHNASAMMLPIASQEAMTHQRIDETSHIMTSNAMTGA